MNFGYRAKSGHVFRVVTQAVCPHYRRDTTEMPPIGRFIATVSCRWCGKTDFLVARPSDTRNWPVTDHANASKAT